jgi:hypothetical protein
MPYPGQVNNPEGRNSFSGPMGQKEPAYGAVEREKVLTRSAPGVSSTESAPRRAQRRAVRRGQGGSGAPPGPLTSPADHGMQEQTLFWQSLLNDPGASPLTREYAMRALGLQG